MSFLRLSRRRARNTRGTRARFQARLELLEGRLAPALLTVNTAADETTPDSGLSLREAIDVVDSGSTSSLSTAEEHQIQGTLGSNDTITFDPSLNGQTITLAGSDLSITRSVTIEGLGAPNLTVSGNNRSQVFFIQGGSVALSGLTVAGGAVNAGIGNKGTLNLTNCVLSQNRTNNDGGAFINGGTAEVTNCTFSGNSAADGGAISNSFTGNLTVTNCTFSGNAAGAGGAIDNFGIANFGTGTLTVTHSAFSGNTANGPGGGIENGPNCRLTVSDCTFSGNSGQNGGGIDNQSSLLLTDTNQFTGNTASGAGGGIENGSSGSLTVDNSSFSTNSANQNGGGIDNQGSLTVTNHSAFSNNTANNDGGGISNNSSGTVTMDTAMFSGDAANNAGGGIATLGGLLYLTNSTVSGNSSSQGGGLFSTGSSFSNVSNCAFANNSTVSGGGIANGSTLVLSNCSLTGNSANNGGGIVNSGTLTLASSTLAGNSAGFGGGAGIFNSSGRCTVTNSTFAANSAINSAGGGIENQAALVLTNCTLSGNSAVGGGGGINNDLGTVTLGNTIVAGNTAGAPSLSPVGPDVYGPVSSQGHNLIGDSSGSSGFGAAGDKVGTGSSPINALLAPLGNDGGPTQTMALLPGSPAIDAGSKMLAVDSSGNPLTTDQRGFARIVNGIVDIGAFESRGFTLLAAGGDGQQALVNTAFAAPLSVTVTSAFGEPVQGGVVTFTAPAGGASAAFAAGSTATLSATGQATATASAGGTAGGYSVIASAQGAAPVSFALTNLSPITVGPASLPDATAGAAYTQMLTASGGAGGPYTFFVTAGALPAGFTLSTSGVVSGSATTVTASSFTVTAADQTGIMGSQSYTLTIDPAAAATFVVSGFPSPTTAGVAGSFTVRAFDAFGNLATGYAGTVSFSSGDLQASLPANGTLTSGAGSFSATLKTAGSQSLTVKDAANSSLTGSETGILVNPAATSKFVVAGFPSPVTAGVAGTFTVIAQDLFGNTTPAYGGAVHFTSSDAQAVLPADATLLSGQGTFSATLKSAGSQSLAATDTVNSSITGTQTGIVVNPAAATHFVLSGPATVIAGTPFSLTVIATDAYGNVATGYRGTVKFGSSDRSAALSGKYTYLASDNGVRTFTGLVLKKKGTQTITVFDATTNSILGTISINVS
jgi:hypothetical protein